MRLYEVRVEKVSADWGRHMGYKTIGYAVDETKANKMAKTWAKRNEINEWWMCYGKNREGHIRVEVVDRGEVAE